MYGESKRSKHKLKHFYVSEYLKCLGIYVPRPRDHAQHGFLTPKPSLRKRKKRVANKVCQVRIVDTILILTQHEVRQSLIALPPVPFWGRR